MVTTTAIISAVVGCTVAGSIGLILFFARRYFVNRDTRSNKNEDHLDTARLDIAGVKAIQDMHTKYFSSIEKQLSAIDTKLTKVFQYIDAPKRATDTAPVNPLPETSHHG